MNSPFRVRLKSHRPRLPPCPVSGLPAAPVFTPSSVRGCKSTPFFRTAKLSEKNFSKSFFPRGSRPLCLPRPPRSRETGPQKYCFFPIRQTFSKEFFVNHRRKRLNSLSSTSKKIPVPRPSPRAKGPGRPPRPGNPTQHAAGHWNQKKTPRKQKAKQGQNSGQRIP